MNPLGRLFFIPILPLLSLGCATLPSHYVRVLPPPIRSFPAAKPGLVRLPVDIIFPSGGDMIHHFGNLLKGGFKQFMPNLYQTPGLDLNSHVKDLWAQMQEPIYLDKGLWLLIQPESLSIGEMRTDLKKASTLHTVLEMTAQPEILFGPEPVTHPVALPALKRFQRGPGTFRAMTNTRISYAEANQYFRDPRLKLIGMVFPGTGERKLTLEGVRLYGSGGQVIAEVKLQYNPPIINFTGKPAKLTVYLRGTPRYLPEKRMFDLPDLDYDIKSSDLLLEIADWIFKSDFKNQLRKIAVLPVGAKLDIITGKIDKALNRPLGRFARLQTQVTSFRVLDGFADNEGIEVRLAIQGNATMEVIWN
jgi:hypothetical protein